MRDAFGRRQRRDCWENEEPLATAIGRLLIASCVAVSLLRLVRCMQAQSIQQACNAALTTCPLAACCRAEVVPQLGPLAQYIEEAA